jgi:WhiB family redox-sensing transcriptional regulator
MGARPLPAGLPPLTLRGLRGLLYSAPRACGEEPGLFFGADAETPAEHAARVASARELCADCPVRLACLARALRNGEESGVWAGLDADAGELAYLAATARLMRKAQPELKPAARQPAA